MFPKLTPLDELIRNARERILSKLAENPLASVYLEAVQLASLTQARAAVESAMIEAAYLSDQVPAAPTNDGS